MVYLPLLMATTISTLVGVIVTARCKVSPCQPAIAHGNGTGGVGLLGAVVLLAPAEAANTFAIRWAMAFFCFGVCSLSPPGGPGGSDAFVEGAKEGFTLAVKIIPYLVAMLAAIAMLRAGGVLGLFLDGIRSGVGALGLDTRFVDALPVALLKPLSGSGARAAMVDVMQTHGVDSLAGRMAAVMRSTETTFYVLTVYFGSVGIRDFRYAPWCGLAADAAGLVSAIFLSYLFSA